MSIDRELLRWPLALVLSGWLVFMGQDYAETIHQRTSWIEDCKEAARGCADRKVFLALVEVVELREDAYVARKATLDHLIYGDSSELRPGETISVIARFDPEQGVLVEEWLEHHPWREAKEALGFAGLGLSVLVLLVGFRRGPQGLEERA
mgnify:CR=1 FL=1